MQSGRTHTGHHAAEQQFVSCSYVRPVGLPSPGVLPRRPAFQAGRASQLSRRNAPPAKTENAYIYTNIQAPLSVPFHTQHGGALNTDDWHSRRLINADLMAMAALASSSGNSLAWGQTGETIKILEDETPPPLEAGEVAAKSRRYLRWRIRPTIHAQMVPDQCTVGRE